ncbi:MAG: hypothetical protein WCO23_00825 [bacterium]
MPEVRIANLPDQKPDDTDKTDNLIAEWYERESDEVDRGAKWHLSIYVGTVVIAGLLFWQKIYSGVFLVVVAAIFVLFFSKNKNKMTKVSLYQKGIRIDDRTYHFSDIKEFSIGRVSGILTLKFTLAGGIFAGFITAPLQEEQAQQVYAFLTEVLPENHDNFSSFIDTLGGYFRR